MFNPQDVYLTSGTAAPFNSWTEYVTKFDTSSFYNWEQDNLPLYDLEARTEQVWHKIGYPIKDGFSGIPGMTFLVSSDATFAGQSSGTVFKSLSAVINVLPNPITFPIIIEVASFGNLGDLELNNIKIDGNCHGAGLEIINRNYVKGYQASSTYGSTTVLSSLDMYNTLTLTSAVFRTSPVPLLSSVTDARLNSNNIIYYSKAPYTATTQLSQTDDSFISYNRSGNFLTSPNGLAVTSYTATDDPSITLNDFVCLREIDGTSVSRTAIANTNPVLINYYGNYLNRAHIKGCEGNIYIRGFLVDGGTGTGATLSHSKDVGFDISESNILLENCGAVRCKNQGFRVVNSDLIIKRGLFAHRIYGLSSTGNTLRTTTESVGLQAINSNLVVSGDTYASGLDLMFQMSRCGIGLELINSNICGGNSRKDAAGNVSGVSYLQAFQNTKFGVRLENSVLDYDGRIDIFNNPIGMKMEKSVFRPNEFTFDFNQSIGLLAEESEILLNKNLYQYIDPGQNGITPHSQFRYGRNGRHMRLVNSTYVSQATSSMPSYHGMHTFFSNNGANIKSTTNKCNVPSIEILGGSYAEIVHPFWQNNNFVVGNTEPLFGSLALIKDNSTVVFLGSKTRANSLINQAITGGSNLQKVTAAVYVDGNSKASFRGPTVIANAAVDVLADNNSIVEFCPHKLNDGSLDVSGWDLSDGKNHTKVDLHARKTNLVARNNSTIKLNNLGDYMAAWPASQTSATDFNLANTYQTSAYTSSGYLQFYSYPQNTLGVLTDTYGSSIGNILTANTFPYANLVSLFGYIQLHPNSYDGHNEINLGGVCVKAVNGSMVEAKNVNTLAGWANASGIHYDYTENGNNCTRLFIWNIDPTSKLNASYFSVSSLYPSLAGYYGPSAVYLSGAAGGVANGAPLATPDTARVSILDSYGTSGGVAGTNYGPYRLYFSPASPAKFAPYGGASPTFNLLYQHVAQGYNPSATASTFSEFSGMGYPELGASTFYYTSALFSNNYRSNILLDESAANSFANSKNAARGGSGRARLVTIYRATTTPGGQGYRQTNQGDGIGFLSAELFELDREN